MIRQIKEKGKVLILDDHPDWRDILTELVVEAGFSAIAVADLPSARLRLQQEQFDILVADVVLQHASYVTQGLWILKDVRRLHQRTRRGPFVVVVSGSDQVGIKEAHFAFVEYGDIVVDFLSKNDFDCEGADLRKALQRALAKQEEQRDREQDGSTGVTNQPKEYQYDVFISYSSDGEEWVERELLSRLRSESIKYIEQLEFTPGRPQLLEMERAIERSRRTLLVLTPGYLRDTWEQFNAILNITYGLDTREWRTVPVVAQTCDLPRELRALVSVDLTTDDIDAWNRLMNALSTGSCTMP